LIARLADCYFRELTSRDISAAANHELGHGLNSFSQRLLQNRISLLIAARSVDNRGTNWR
jgi:hypothetical protein